MITGNGTAGRGALPDQYSYGRARGPHEEGRPADRKALAERLRDEGLLRSERILDAFEHVDRADFVPPEHVDRAYEDVALPIGEDQDISQPTVVAFMLELLKPQRGERVLDIGAGSGWTTALLAHIVGEQGSVTGADIVPQLVALARANLRKYRFPHARVVQAYEGTLGLPDEDKFDRILVGAAAREFPEELLAQLRVHGRMVIPVGGSIWMAEKVSTKRIVREEHRGFSFVPLRY